MSCASGDTRPEAVACALLTVNRADPVRSTVWLALDTAREHSIVMKIHRTLPSTLWSLTKVELCESWLVFSAEEFTDDRIVGRVLCVLVELRVVQQKAEEAMAASAKQTKIEEELRAQVEQETKRADSSSDELGRIQLQFADMAEQCRLAAAASRPRRLCCCF